MFAIYDLRIKYIKRTKNTKADILNKKPEYKNKQKLKDLAIFRRDRDNLAINYR
jgi:hypothetical protein